MTGGVGGVGGADVVEVWLARDDVPEPVLAELFAVLDPDEQERAEAFLRAADRRRFVVAHGAARFIVAGALGAPAGEIRWQRGPHGKPGLAGRWTGIQVNLSHSGDLCAIAVSAVRHVGVDIQRLTPGLDVAAMANRYFRPEEAGFVLATRRADVRSGRFAQLWARKEAFVKAVGGRLMAGMPTPLQAPGGVVDVRDAATQDPYRVTDVPVPAGFRAAVALSGHEGYEVVHRWWMPPADARSGMSLDPRTLDPQIAAMRDRRARDATPQLYSLTLEEARAADLASIKADGGLPEPVHEVEDRRMPRPGGELPVRIYRPKGDRPLPALLYFFGGGWTLGSIDTADGICRSLANAAGCLVVTVGYRLAPEHPFPAAVEDCHAALRWVRDHADDLGADPDRLAVGGDSAGGNLAAAVSLLAREGGDVDLVGQLLVYPNTDQEADDASIRENDDPWLFNRRSVAWYRGHYLADPADADDPLASPLRAADLSGLPPALVVTAEFDPLRDQGEAYARRLADAGVPVELHRYPGMVHGFFAMAGSVDGGKAAVGEAANALRAWFAEPDSTT